MFYLLGYKDYPHKSHKKGKKRGKNERFKNISI